MQSRLGEFLPRLAKIGLCGLAIAIAAPAFAIGGAQADAKQDMAAQLAAVHLPEPLIRTSPTKRSEDRDLLRALAAYARRSTPDDFTSLTVFLKGHPHSGWRVSLWTDLGLSYLHYGYFSYALDALGAAWKEGKDASGLRIKAEVDRAAGELVLLHAELGHAEQVAALLKEIGNRPVSGPATTTVQLARETLWVMQNDPKHLWLCGPLALRFLMLAQGISPKKADFLQWYRYRATPKGVSLAELERLSDKAGESYVAIYRSPDQPVPVPSVVHWKVGHYAAIIAKENGGYQVYDPVLGAGDHWITAGALKAESSGYFLVRADQAKSAGWRQVAGAEAGQVWGAGPTNGPTPNSPNGTPCNCQTNGGGGGLTSYDISELAVGVILTDTPVGYAPQKGPPARVTISYSQWEASQPAAFSFFNISPKWTFNFLTYVQDDPSALGSNVILYRPGGGDSPESGYNITNGAFAADELDESVLVLTSQSPVVYTRTLRDGTVETYAESDGGTSYPRHVFLSTIADPQGNTLTLNYQTVSNQILLTSLTDATGRQTTFTYGNASFPLQVTKITDPFGRSATLNYDSQGRLISITDVLGLTSSYTYDSNSLVDALTTPYGTTTFNYGGSGNGRWVQVTDPLGNNEREETLQPAPVPYSDPPDTVPQGIVNPYNANLDYRDSFHWDQYAYVVAGCTLTGNLPSTCNYSDARDTHFTHYAADTNLQGPTIESRKYPLENRIWTNYPGQTSETNCNQAVSAGCSGTYDQLSAVGRVLDDGSTQLTQYIYNAAGNLIQYVDPAGRYTYYVYAANNIDVVEVDQFTGSKWESIASYTYNQQHRPLTYTDAAGQVTNYTYNSAGQVTQIALPLGRVWNLAYDNLGRLTTVTDPNGAAAMSYTYDAFDRIATATDSEGYTLSYSYDAADRLTQITYLDGTMRTYTYNNLDLVSAIDRQGHTTTYTYDADRRLVSILNAAGGLTQYSYFPNGVLQSLTDPDGNTTSWSIDVESRVTQKQYANGARVNYTYEATTSRLQSVTDAVGQTKQLSYTVDDRLAGISYVNAKESTPAVSFSYDPYFPRLRSNYDSVSGTTLYSYLYSYVPVGSPGALRLQQESVLLAPANSFAIAYQYDAAGRLTTRTVAGTQETFAYDNLDRLTSDTNPLGTFDISYLGQTDQPVSRQLAGTSDQIAWSYLPNSGDRRLAGINNYAIRQYQFTTTPEALITAINQQASSGSETWNFTYDAGNRLTDATLSTGLQYGFALDNAGNIQSVQTATGTTMWRYSDVNELVSAEGGGAASRYYTYDLDGERLSDANARRYTWDAENRLVGIVGSTDEQFSYDALGRRVAITSKSLPVPSTRQFLWCGAQICQSSGASGNVLRQYFAEGEYIPATGTKLYYGRDQLGSVRDVGVVTAQGTSTQSYDYDPYGNTLSAPTSGRVQPLGPHAAMPGNVMQASVVRVQPLSADGAIPSTVAQVSVGQPTPDFLYAGMYYDSGSGLYLTQYRAYDPSTAGWLSRDPLGEMNDLGPFNLSPETLDPAPATLPPLPPVDTFTPGLLALPGGDATTRAIPDGLPTVIILPGAAVRAPSVPALILSGPAASDRSNLYAYVSDDPINRVDRLGLCWGWLAKGIGWAAKFLPGPWQALKAAPLMPAIGTGLGRLYSGGSPFVDPDPPGGPLNDPWTYPPPSDTPTNPTYNYDYMYAIGSAPAPGLQP